MKTFTKNQLMKALTLNEQQMDALLRSINLPTDITFYNENYLNKIQQHLTYQNRLQNQVTNRKIILDTSSVLHPCFPRLIEHLLPILRQGQQLILPHWVKLEIFKISHHQPHLQQTIHTAIDCIINLEKEGLLQVYGEGNNSFGDSQLLSIATRLLTKNRLMIITQDHKLSLDLLHLNKLQSVYGEELQVYRINRYGYLSRFRTDDEQSHCVIPSAPLVTDTNLLIPVDLLPSTGEVVTGISGTMVLGNVLGRGGEGVVYDLGDGTAAKVFHREKLTAVRKNKLDLMVSHPVNCSGICWPKEMLYNQHGQFIGYRMDKANGVSLQSCLMNQSSVLRYFPSGERIELVQLAVTILEKISVLHKSGVLLGDINLRNILMVSPKEVWLVDCDSYQVGGYPCPVGNIQFTPPELQGHNFSTQLRTSGQEAFAVATLLFMLMLPGKAPYARQGSENTELAIRKMEFPYSSGDRHGKGTPPIGTWRFIWSNLPRTIKDNFYDTFQKGGIYSTEQTRLPVTTWLFTFRRYLQLLQTGALQSKDEQSGKIFPTRWKIGGTNPRTTGIKQVCIECGETFIITPDEEKYYLRLGYKLPKKCQLCRQMQQFSNLLNISQTSGI